MYYKLSMVITLFGFESIGRMTFAYKSGSISSTVDALRQWMALGVSMKDISTEHRGPAASSVHDGLLT